MLGYKSSLTVDKRKHKVDVIWQIKSGPKCEFAEIVLSGNQYVKAATIKSQIAFKQGDVYQLDLINKTQDQIYALGMFHVVSVKAILAKEEQSQVPVQIHVQEAPRQSTRFGIGYGKEDKFRTFMSLQRLAVLRRSFRFNLFVKHSDLEPYRVEFKLTKPNFITPTTNLIINPFFLKEREPSFTVKRKGVNTTVQHKLTKYTTTILNYTLERV